ncbi:Spy/CpxP family protein refolding chaperone [Xanthobacter sp. KR7-65]|uniref:Spy/CpxP family protein refolding chaperone n=1 Tax=Xanthobacter sp. KR7-65 TaxID=3156612 RepID=UPI0032B51763
MTGHIEGRLAFLKTELKITDVQESKWIVFADAVRANAKAMMGMRDDMMQVRVVALPVRLERIEKAMALCQESLRTIKASVESLYASFSDEQKRAADQLMVSPMGLF